MKIWPLPIVEITSAKSIVEQRKVALIYTNPAYAAVKDRLAIMPDWQAEVHDATLVHWDALGADLEGG